MPRHIIIIYIYLLFTTQQPQFEGRQVVTFHNQRDFIFVRHHRYIYRQEEDTNLSNKELAKEKTVKSKKQKKRDREAAAAAALEEEEEDQDEMDDDDNRSSRSTNGKNSKIPIKTRARLQELGPRFTLKLKWLQEGVLDTEFGEYEWIMGKKNQMKAVKKKFYLQ